MSTTTSSSSTSSTATPSLSLDFNDLISRFADFTAFTPSASGWNDDNGKAVCFVMAGSEYRLRKPELTPGTRTLSQADRNAFNARLDGLRARITAEGSTATAAQQSAFLADLDRAEAAFASATTLPLLRIDAAIDHIRNNQQDDHCALRVEVVWAEALQCWMPSSVSAGFTWGTNVLAVPDEVIDLFQLPTGGPVLSMLPVSIFPVYGQIAQLGQYLAIAMMAWNFAVRKLSSMADDGGRLYFPEVVLQCLVRILNSITPQVQPLEVPTIPAPDLDGIGRTWRADYEKMSVIGQPVFRKNFYDIVQDVVGMNITVTGVYRVFLPDLVWLPGGAGCLQTFKIKVQDTDGCAAIVMLFDNSGLLQMMVGSTQLGTQTVLRHSTSPTWRSSPAQSVDGMVNSFIVQDFGAGAMNADAPVTSTKNDDLRDNNMGNIMSEVMKSFGNHVRLISSSLIKTGLPQLPSLTSHNDQRYDSGSRPFVAIAPSGKAVEVHFNPDSTLFRDVLNASGTAPVTIASSGKYYQDGQDPTIAVLADGATVLEVHGGNTDNNLFYSVGSLSGSTLTLPDKGTSYDKGEDPCLAVANRDGANRIFEVHRSETAGSTNLYFNTATWSGGRITWSASGTLYDTGTSPFAAFAPDQDTLLVTHEDGGDIKVRVGNSKESSVSWFAASAVVMSGAKPTIAVTTDNRVVLFAEDSSGNLLYSLGVLSSAGAIRWAVAGVRQHTGRWACLARMSEGKLLLAYENTKSPGDMFGSIQSVAVPAGYYD